MQFNQKSTRVILGTLTVSFGLFLVFCVSTSFGLPSARSVHAYTSSAAPQTGDACQPMFAALEKNVTTPYHMYMTQTSAAVQNGKPRSSEIISVAGMRYILVDGKWAARQVSAEQSKAAVQQARENAKNGTCRYVRDEAVNGESALLIATHGQSGGATSDTQIWISNPKD